MWVIDPGAANQLRSFAMVTSLFSASSLHKKKSWWLLSRPEYFASASRSVPTTTFLHIFHFTRRTGKKVIYLLWDYSLGSRSVSITTFLHIFHCTRKSGNKVIYFLWDYSLGQRRKYDSDHILTFSSDRNADNKFM